ncbi:hypothetical protein CP973_03370 [Streptomyces albofaciens JCM 4342]|uniref:hypothetical protein n=1 Tax=Streptomyces albofaciens TaxID=66866 RepID=UPI00123BC5CD|nr:hypothetical protein [Streptomyces albofaciens]KAA6221137.1 hypothetical protein CP973_03370 [Streptomyces albofaciens JCM 4342]
MRTARITAAAAAGVVMLAGLTACGGKDGGNKAGGGSPVQAAAAALRTASEKTGSEKSAKVESTTKTGQTTQSMKGAMDWSQGMRMNVETTGQGGLGGGKPMKALYTPEAMYLNLGLGGKPWMKYDYNAMAKKSPVFALLKDQMQNNNPSRSVGLVLATGKAEKVGTEDVRGVKATHYTATFDVAELTRMQASKDFSEKDMKSMEESLRKSGTKNETIDLWIGPDDLLVKKTEKMQNNQGGFESTVFYSDYGTKVSVEEPPASQVTDAAGAMGGGLAG